MSGRRTILAMIGLAAIGLHGSARAQAQKLWRIGYVGAVDRASVAVHLDAFRAGLREHGYVEGRNLSLEYHYANGQLARLDGLAEDLVKRGPDLILAHSTPASLAAKKSTTSIPVIIVGVADPVGVGLVASLSRPGGNLTGITNLIAELGGKRLELLAEILPKLAQVAVMVNPDDPNAKVQLRYAEDAARTLGLELRPILAVRGAADLDGAFASAVKSGAGGVMRMVDPLLAPLRKQTVELAAKHRLPVIYPFREDVEAGGLISYGADLPAQFKMAAAIANRILKGARPADLPVEQPTRFELVVNAKVAKAMGIALPSRLLLRADRVIE